MIAHQHLHFPRVKLTMFLQESLAAMYGAGISNACVVDIGAVKTSVACVDEGLVISDSRYIHQHSQWSF